MNILVSISFGFEYCYDIEYYAISFKLEWYSERLLLGLDSVVVGRLVKLCSVYGVRLWIRVWRRCLREMLEVDRFCTNAVCECIWA